jgi:hypothetical protein
MYVTCTGDIFNPSSFAFMPSIVFTITEDQRGGKISFENIFDLGLSFSLNYYCF